MHISWGRGFLRTWAVLAVLWILFTGWNECQNWVMHPDAVRAKECWDRLAKWLDGKLFDVYDAFDEYTPEGSTSDRSGEEGIDGEPKFGRSLRSARPYVHSEKVGSRTHVE